MQELYVEKADMARRGKDKPVLSMVDTLMQNSTPVVGRKDELESCGHRDKAKLFIVDRDEKANAYVSTLESCRV
ncbi:hypothetical protein V1477_020315 [Vespula maculifrons]|uniref:Uncharacterized protein n=1 Tax=Vespula maculifrons TaxID=7453 RepID=A0ABD2ANR2_VESMC